MDGLRPHSAATAALARHFTDDFVLVDVGCAGGVDGGWRSFGDRLRVYGFDAGLDEVHRLNRAETNPKARYVSAFVGVGADHPLRELSRRFTHWRRSPWTSLAAFAALERLDGRTAPVPGPVTALRAVEADARRLTAEVEAALTTATPTAAGLQAPVLSAGAAGGSGDAALMHANQWHKAALADPGQPLRLEDALQSLGCDKVDFLKIDVDGPDYEILYSMADRLDALGVLGVGVEVNFFGSDAAHHHTFHNTDRLMRAAGFALFDLSVRRYASSALPLPFLLDYPSQSASGRPFQGDALYLRDYAFIPPGQAHAGPTPANVLKLSALCALFGLPDQAAEILLRFRGAVEAAGVDIEAQLDLLALQAQEGQPGPLGYKDYMAAFKAGDEMFFGAASAPLRAPSGEAEAELARMKRSFSWRVTAPLRRLRSIFAS